MITKHYALNTDGELVLTTAGSSEAAVTVKEVTTGHFRIETDQYYHRDGVLRLEITQPLDRVLKTFEGLLEIDALLHEGKLPKVSPS